MAHSSTQLVLGIVAAVLLGSVALAHAADDALYASRIVGRSSLGVLGEQIVTEAGGVALQTIADARKALAGRDLARASREAGQALRLLVLVRNASPPLCAEAQIANLRDRLTMRRTDVVETDWQQMLAEFEAYERFAERVDPVGAKSARARGHIDRARRLHAEGKTRAAAAELSAARQTMVYVDSDIALRSSLIAVERAIAKLDAGRVAAAAKLFETAEAELIRVVPEPTAALPSELVQGSDVTPSQDQRESPSELRGGLR